MGRCFLFTSKSENADSIIGLMFIKSPLLFFKEEKKAKEEEFWNNIEVGKKYTGTVTAISDYGAFVDIGGFQGLLHISEITGIPAKEEMRLKEQNFGKYESTARDGAKFREAKKQFVERYEGGESMLQLAQRVYNLLDEVKASGKTCILVAHNGIARVVQSYFYEMTNEEYAAFGVDNCAILQYEFSGEENGGAKA